MIARRQVKKLDTAMNATLLAPMTRQANAHSKFSISGSRYSMGSRTPLKVETHSAKTSKAKSELDPLSKLRVDAQFDKSPQPQKSTLE